MFSVIEFIIENISLCELKKSNLLKLDVIHLFIIEKNYYTTIITL